MTGQPAKQILQLYLFTYYLKMPKFFKNRFVFPDNLDEIKVIPSKQYLPKMLRKQWANKQKEEMPFKIQSVDQKFIYAQCSLCKAELRYAYSHEKRGFQLYHIRAQHEHDYYPFNYDNLKKQINQLPDGIIGATAIKILKEKVNCSRTQFYRIFNKIKNQQWTLEQMFNSFSGIQALGHYQPVEQPNIPSLIVFTTNEMKKQFYRFGEFVCFDLTFSLVREKSCRGSQYRVGFFVGLNNNNRIIPYAVVFTDSQDTESFAKIFYQFFQVMGKQPATIITDEQPTIHAGLKALEAQNKWNGSHLLDSFHILRNAERKLIGEESFEYFKKLIHAENKPLFHKILAEAEDQIVTDDQKILAKFVEKKEYYCFAYAPPTFLGLSITSSICEKTNDLIKRRLPLSQKLSIVLKKCYDLCAHMIANCNERTMAKFPVQKWVRHEEISRFRRIFCERVLRQITKKFIKTLNCVVKSEEQGVFLVSPSSVVNHWFQVKEINQKYVCTCQFQQKTGIPCEHIVKIIILKGKQLQNYIDKRWVLEEQKDLKELQKDQNVEKVEKVENTEKQAKLENFETPEKKEEEDKQIEGKKRQIDSELESKYTF